MSLPVSRFLFPKRILSKMLERTCSIFRPFYWPFATTNPDVITSILYIYWPMNGDIYDLSGFRRHITKLHYNPSDSEAESTTQFKDFGGVVGRSLYSRGDGAHYYDTDGGGLFLNSQLPRQLDFYFSIDSPTAATFFLYEEKFYPNYPDLTDTPAAPQLWTLVIKYLSTQAIQVYMQDGDGNVVYDQTSSPITITARQAIRFTMVQTDTRMAWGINGAYLYNVARPDIGSDSPGVNYARFIVGDSGTTTGATINNLFICATDETALDLLAVTPPPPTFTTNCPNRNTHGHLEPVIASSHAGVPFALIGASGYLQENVRCHATHIFGGGQRSGSEKVSDFREGVKFDVLIVVPKVNADGREIIVRENDKVNLGGVQYDVQLVQDAGGADHHWQVFGRVVK